MVDDCGEDGSAFVESHRRPGGGERPRLWEEGRGGGSGDAFHLAFGVIEAGPGFAAQAGELELGEAHLEPVIVELDEPGR